MSKSRNNYNAEKKVEILREHLENQVPISELSRRYKMHPNMIHKWKKQLFEGALDTFSGKQKNNLSQQNHKSSILEEKLKDRDSLIAEIMSDNIRLKKKLTGDL
jgi:transposase